MVETDAPYMSPEPVRKQKPNEPALMVHTAKFLADLQGCRSGRSRAGDDAECRQVLRLGRVPPNGLTKSSHCKQL